MRRLTPYLILAGLIILAAAVFFDRSPNRTLPAGPDTSNAFVVGNDALARIPASVRIAHRVGFHAQGDAPELAYVSQSGPCAANGMVDDGGSCINAGDGNSWKAVFPTGRIDIRQFGAIPDNSTPADAAVRAANVYSAGIGACTYVPSIYPGFTFQNPIALNNAGSNCLAGDRGIKIQPAIGPFGKFVDLNFPNDSDGIVVNAPNGWHVGGLSIKGNAAFSASPTHTRGIYIKSVVEGTITNIFVQDFVVCKSLASSATFSLRDIFCDDQSGYPNIANEYPFACTEMENAGAGATAAFQESGGECRAQAGGADALYRSDGSTRWYQVCAPITFPASGVQATGSPLACSGPTEYGVPLWRADGIKVRVGPLATLPNGQDEYNAPMKVCGVDYTIWDVSAAGGGGSGGTQLYCNQMNATLTAGSPTVVVAATAGIPTGASILVTADHGLPVATKVQRVTDGTHLVLSKTPYINGTVMLNITQIAVATSGSPSYSQNCHTTNSCGYKIEIRFKSAPANGTAIDLQWSDPTGYVGYLANAVSDYLYLQPMLVGGWDVGLKHVGLSDGGIEFRPTYIELLNQCASVEANTHGDVLVFHRIINDPIPSCPGYIDPTAGPTIAAFNNVYQYLNGATVRAGHPP
jgi:hypothetical protein